MLRLLLFLFSLMPVFSSIATTYTLPDDATALPGTCSASNSTVTCNSNLIFSDNDVIQLNPGSLPVQLTITGDFTFGSNFDANVGGAADDFSIQVNGNINPQNNAQIYTNITTDGNINSATGVTWVGNLSANGNVVLGANSSVTGNISSNNDVNIDSGTSVNGNINTTGTVNNNGAVSGYVNAAEVNDSSGGIQGETCDVNNNIGACSDSQQLVYYTFEDANWTSPDPIADSSGNGNNSSVLGSANILLPGSQVSCQALDVPSNTSDSEFDGLDTGLDINDDIGNTGSISFWYRSDADWSSSSGRQLFDASNESPVGQSGEKHFYLALQSGELEFGVEDDGDLGLFVNLANLTFSANEWVHIAVTWDLENEEIAITVTTSSVSSSNSNTRSGISSQLGDMDTLYIGDNRSGYRTQNSSQNSANGQFDNVRIYNFVQTSTQIQTDVDNVSTCPIDNLAHYTFEDDSWTSSDPIADASSNNNDGSALGSADIVLPSSLVSCQALDVPANTSDSEFDGLDTGLDINDDIGNSGTISFWYRSDADWSSSSGRQLFDASNENPVGQSGEKHFYLALKSGELEFGIEDDGDLGLFVSLTNLTFAADEWVHIAATWDLGNEETSITVTTASVSSSNSNTRSGISSQLGDIDTLYIGDNRSGYRIQNSSQNSANGQFDDVRIYNFVQNSAAIQADVDDVVTCPADNLAHYQFEDENWTSSDPIEDSSGNNHNGNSVGSANILLPGDQVACQALDVPQNTTSDAIDGLDTGLNVSSDIGDSGTISFWYKSNESWDSGKARQLFDASREDTDSKFFFLVLRHTGKLRFALEDANDHGVLTTTASAYSFAADEWQHIAVTWDMASLTMQIYVNAVEQNTRINDQSGADSGLGELNSLYIGDNRSTYNVSGSVFNSANGQFDDVRIYNYVQSASEVNADYQNTTTCAGAIYYQFEHDGSGLTCQAESIILRACTDSDCDDEYDQAVTVSLAPSGWVGGDSVTFTGNTQLQLSITSPGSQTLDVLNDSADCLDTADSSSSCEIEFVDTAFEFYDRTSGTSNLPDQLAEASFSNLVLRAIRTDESTGACEVAISGNQSIDFSYDCTDPDECKTAFAGIPIANALGTNSGTLDLNFDASGEADLSALSFDDAGRLSMQASKTLENGKTLNGSTSVDIYPAQLVLNTSDYPSSSDNASSANSIAGQAYDLTVTAAGANGGALPNYQPGQLQLYVERILPNGVGVDGSFQLTSGVTQSSSESASFADISNLTFSNGVFTSSDDSFYTEVGSIIVDVQDADYLGNTVSSSGADTLSNFTPAFFDVIPDAVTPVFVNTCNSTFTYIGDNFSFDSEALPIVTVVAANARYDANSHDQSSSGYVTENYDFSGAFDATYTETEDTGYAGSFNFSASTDHTELTAYNGWVTFTIEDAQISYGKAATPLVPFNAQMDISYSFVDDSPGTNQEICYQASYTGPGSCDNFVTENITGASMRYGRLRFENVYGPETEDLQMPLYAEYYNGSDWILNSDDSCTPIDWQAGQELTLTSENTSLPNNLTSDGILANGIPNSDDDLLFTRPGAGKVGSVIVELDTDQANVSYLNIDWDGDGDIDTDDIARAIATFGQYRGNDRIIHWREQF